MFLYVFSFLLISVLSFGELNFDSWSIQNNKLYTDHEYYYRKHVWETNFMRVMNHNRQNKTYRLGMNKFADMTYDEFKSKVLMSTMNNDNIRKTNYVTPNRSVNWRAHGVVQEVNDQGMCGSCWAFSAAETLSAAYGMISNNKSFVLSPQELVDCVPDSYDCFGCMGGWPNRAMEFALNKLHGGLLRWRDYPYVGNDQKCDRTNINETVVVGATSVVNVTKGNQSELLDALNRHGPISVCIYVDDDFMLYESGIYSSTTCPTDEVNHAVLLYGIYYDTFYNRWTYMIRNSWGADVQDNHTGFGVDGDVFMDAEVSNGNICALASYASYVR